MSASIPHLLAKGVVLCCAVLIHLKVRAAPPKSSAGLWELRAPNGRIVAQCEDPLGCFGAALDAASDSQLTAYLRTKGAGHDVPTLH